MNEQEFIYSKLHYLTEQVEYLTNVAEKQSELIGGLVKIVEQMQSPEYASRQSKVAQAVDVAEKIKFVREHINKK